MAEPKHGDSVKVVTRDKEYFGILMPRPAILGSEHAILKRDSGYNIGISNKKIKEMVLIKASEPRVRKKVPLKKYPKLPTVLILSTGGTISSKIDYRSGGVSADYSAEDFVEMLPELKAIANVRASKPLSIMSEDASPSDWSLIAGEIAKEIDTVDGIVVTHGTDTLHYSTAAASFALQNLGKPVIFTASQRSIDRGSSDAFMNLLCAVRAAAVFDFGGVATCLHATSSDDYCLLIRGTKVRKMHTSRRDAFRPINEKALAKVLADGNIEVINPHYHKRHDGAITLKNSFEKKVALVLVHPGMDPGVIDYYLEKGCKGIVLSATGLGHLPVNNRKHSLLPQLKKASKKGIPVIITSQCLYGAVHPFVYTNLRRVSMEGGGIFAEDMLPEVAFVKLAWVLGQATDYETVKRM